MFHINVLLTVKAAGDVAKVSELLRECGRRSRQEPGCVRYDAFHSQAEPKLFLLVECWESEAAWQAHREAAAVQEIYLPQVIPLVDRAPHISTRLD